MTLVKLLFCGDVMTGRGIDQILPHPGDPTLHEPYVSTAVDYLELAEQHSGPIPRCVPFSYIWGDALLALERIAPDLRIINLETAVTTSNDYWPVKEIHYRMNPANVPCLTAAKITCCVLANNHVLDWGYRGLDETLATLARASIATVGAGPDIQHAERPAALELPSGRVLVFAFGSTSSGVGYSWAATKDRAGVNLLDQGAGDPATRVAGAIQRFRRPGDLVILSLHWGPNWGYETDSRQRQLAHRLIDQRYVDLIHGHSAHHVKGIEVYKGKLILYGCGDFLTDYEGIQGRESFRNDLGLMYFASIERETGNLAELQMKPTQIRRFQVRQANPDDASWLAETLSREGRPLGTWVEHTADGLLGLHWKC